MLARYEVLTDLETKITIKEAFARDVLIGLSSSPKRIPSKYFYDEEGSKLFQKITELIEYYPTRCEHEIFENYKREIGDHLEGQTLNVVELGPGDARKTRVLLQHFLDRKLDFRYVPIDISEAALVECVRSLEAQFPKLMIHGLVSEYFNALNWLKNLNHRKNFVLFLGSNIGNFNANASRVFLHSLWNSLNPHDYVLIGFDLKKDIDLLLRAYNDSKGVTREFNLNLLRRVNRELGGNFNIENFIHYASYNVFSGAMESYLVSKARQEVMVQEIGQSFSFDPWEPIHTEYSYKYLESDIEKLAEDTGFEPVARFYDRARFFTNVIWQVRKQ